MTEEKLRGTPSAVTPTSQTEARQAYPFVGPEIEEEEEEKKEEKKEKEKKKKERSFSLRGMVSFWILTHSPQVHRVIQGREYSAHFTLSHLSLSVCLSYRLRAARCYPALYWSGCALSAASRTYPKRCTPSDRPLGTSSVTLPFNEFSESTSTLLCTGAAVRSVDALLVPHTLLCVCACGKKTLDYDTPEE
jgi:hypothetical protein